MGAQKESETLGEESLRIIIALRESGVRADLPYATIVARVIGEIRKARGISQEDLARRAGITQSSLSRVENGDTVFNADHAISLAPALEIEPHHIFAIADHATKWLREHDLQVSGTKLAAQNSVLGPGAARLLVGAMVAGAVGQLVSIDGDKKE